MRKHTIAVLAGIAVVISACSSSGGGDAGLGAGEGYTVLGALAELPPAPDEVFLVQTADLIAATELAGLERPEELDPATAVDWLNPLTGLPLAEGEQWAPVFVPPPTVTHEAGVHLITEFDDLAGWSVLDVDSYAEYGTAPHTFSVLAGEFDETTLEHLPEVGDGVRTVGEGEDLWADVTAASAVSRIGQPVRMAHHEGLLAVAPHTDRVQEWLGDPEETLAEDEGLAAVAGALDEAEVVSAMLSVGGAHTLQGGPLAESSAPDAESVLAQLEDRMDYLPEAAFDIVGIGWTARDGEPVMVLAYHFGTQSSAEASVDQLDAVFTEGQTVQDGLPLAELFEVEEITAHGPVVVVTLQAAHPRAPHQLPTMLMARDLPFLHQ